MEWSWWSANHQNRRSVGRCSRGHDGIPELKFDGFVRLQVNAASVTMIDFGLVFGIHCLG
jgi:hypothetical protein